MSTREEALQENSTLNEKSYRKTIHASEAQQANVESFLKLEDPSLELRDRAWLWNFSFRIQSLQPMGTGKVATSNFDLASYGRSLMPSLELGMLMEVMQRPSMTWTSGLSARAGASTQSTKLMGSNGYVYDDARLNTMILSGVWNNRLSMAALKNWILLLEPEIGAINYTQTASGTDLANFSQQNSFWGMGLGVEYVVNKKWGLVAEYKRRTAGTADIAKSNIQNDNYEIGTSVVW
jgi:hypothetical protein